MKEKDGYPGLFQAYVFNRFRSSKARIFENTCLVLDPTRKSAWPRRGRVAHGAEERGRGQHNELAMARALAADHLLRASQYTDDGCSQYTNFGEIPFII